MTYYEELGVTEDASREEIRRAYRRLVRVLHPDQYQDAEMRLAAESRLKRVHEIVAVLADEGARRRYDREVLRRALRVEGSAAQAKGLRHGRSACAAVWVWVGAGLILAGGMFWVVRENRYPEQQRVKAPVPEVAGADSQPAGRLPSVNRPRRKAAQESVEPERLRVEAEARAPVKFEAPAPPRIPEATPEIAVPEVRAIEPPESRYAGSWVYVPKADGAGGALYAPVYIEMAVREVGEEVEGRYAARYRVPDRPISPAVGFEFRGKVAGASTELDWSGGGGAKGRIQLKPVGDGSMEVNWWVVRFGKGIDLASGTAVLTRVK